MADFFAPEYENCICITAGDDKAIFISNLNCDGSRIRNLAGTTIEWGLADSNGNIVASDTFVQGFDQDYITFILTNAITSVLGGKYSYHVRTTDAGGFVTTLGCGCIFIKKCVF